MKPTISQEVPAQQKERELILWRWHRGEEALERGGGGDEQSGRRGEERPLKYRSEDEILWGKEEWGEERGRFFPFDVGAARG